ncbi:MAG TPA: T9SS type A sorting domain-containing protein [Draconibacterium sp.]|nr:T9SS type A sorting domain-containing protein [Draconibacterium sp.]
MKAIILLIISLTISVSSFSQEKALNPDSTQEVKSELKIYPNPCKNDKITLDFPDNEIKEIQLTNITGKQVLRKRYDYPLPKVQLQIHDIPNGIYLVQITTTEDKHTVKKLLISRN